MTLNSAIKRIKTIALAHNQVRRFEIGLTGDLFVDWKAKYVACNLQYLDGIIDITNKATVLNFRMWLLDMIHQSQDTKQNVDDVLSDTLSIIMDIVAQMSHSSYTDWRISKTNNLQVQIEEENDILAGWYMDFSVSIFFTQNICQIPTELTDYTPTTDSNMTILVYDKEYIATGNEGSTLNIPELVGKNVLMGTRENTPIYKVSSNPDPAEFTWNNTSIGLGTVANPGERFLFLYRQYLNGQ